MKDEFPITRLFCLNIKNISSVIFHHIAVDTSRYNRFYKEDILNSLRKCEQDIDDLDNNLNYAEWSPWNWPQMIRELIDSVEYRAELQDAYDWAYGKGVTTMSPIDNANMYGAITRAEMAKMVSVFATKEL